MLDDVKTSDSSAIPPVGAQEGSPVRLVYFAPDFTEVTTINRALGFVAQGFDFTVFAFRRGRYNPDFEARWREVELGRTQDGRYLQRAFALLGALPVLWRHRRGLKNAGVLYARNMDQLVLAFLVKLFFAHAAILVYEVMDVSPTLIGESLRARVFRWCERQLLHRIALLVVSSPGFLRNFYLAVQDYRGQAFVLENKLHPQHAREVLRNGSVAKFTLPRRRYKWIVGYFGLIRGQKTFDLMTRLAERFREDVLFYFRGIVTTVDARSFVAALARNPNMVYGGPYVNPEDLTEIYGAVDMVWALDFEHEDHNSRWLMPCRLYEAGACGVPSIAARGFEVGNRVEQLGIGWTISAPYEDSLTEFFSKLTRQDFKAAKQRLGQISRSVFVSEDVSAALCSVLEQAAGKSRVD
jgi:succinoglycan biosynthesis protein ExoL